ncbi:MAG: bifunctional phosphopantothenoylcysteine decarboxylase/phosphopantothenate--cysteine ligase CoaBC [Pseudomonadota bacterium]
MTKLSGKRVLVGVCGGIAAYKAAELVRLLKVAGADVRVVMTRAAAAFVAPLTFQALSGNEVYLDLLDPDQEAAMGHISLSRWAEQIIIAPATADFIAKLRAGLADDLLSTLCLAAEVPIRLAPAMNRAMWINPATRDNIDSVARRGISILGPDQGEMACGETGVGRMLEPVEILSLVFAEVVQPALAGVSVLVSAGPTREAIDPVRYVTSRSSGKMGYAVAQAAAAAGAAVTLVSGPVNLESPREVSEIVCVESARDMHGEIMARAANHDIYIGAAAVADYAPVAAATGKIKKRDTQIHLSLERTRDILADVAALENGPFTVGFAAETDDLENYAREKLKAKSLDMIAANWVGRNEGGFESDDNALLVLWPEGKRKLVLSSKKKLAQELVELIAEKYHAQHST